MKFVVTADLIIIFFCSLTCLIALVFLLLALIYRRQCFNFPTLLACNTCVAVFVYASNNLAIAIYMLVWDQKTVVTADTLCPIRAYLHYDTTGLMYHSYILQAVQRYCRIKGINIFNTRFRQVLLVGFQWVISLSFYLPVSLTGYSSKLLSDNVCFLPVYEAGLQTYSALMMFAIPNMTITVLYRRLVAHVRANTSTTLGNRERQMNRDLTMVRRISSMVSGLIVCGIPFCIFLIIGWIHLQSVPPYQLHVAFITASASLPTTLFTLTWITPDIRKSLLHAVKKLHSQLPAVFTIANRVRPIIAHLH
jgi:hypothetical protein